jgi:hypothetical protein
MRALAGVLVGLATALSVGGCAHAQVYPAVHDLTSDEVCARLTASAEARHNASGHVRAKLPGVAGVVAHADLDVVLERPARANLAVRSFFEQPMQVLATDGSEVTLYDSTRSEGRFFCGTADDGAFTSLLPIPVRPDDAVSLFLGAAPIEGARCKLTSVDDATGTYEATFERPRRGAVVVRARATDHAIVEERAFTGDGRPLLWMRYGDYVAQKGILFPRRWTLSAYQGDTLSTVVFTSEGLDVNGAPFDDEAFRLAPPDGEPCLPLPTTAAR